MALRDTVFKYKVLLLHLSFWVLYFSYRIYDIYGYTGLQKALIYAGLPMFFNVIACYVHYIFILPSLFQNKNWKKYFLKLIVLLLPVLIARILVENQIYPLILPNEA